jgi:aspartate-semialdehyde dehydrogenase
LAEKRAGKTNGVADRPLVAVVGGDTMLGREIRQLLSEANPVPRIQLIAASAPDTEAVLSEQDEEPVVMVPLSAESLEHSRAAFLAGSAASARRALKLNPKGGPVLIDLTGALEEQPQARLRAPSCEPPAEPHKPTNGSAAKVGPSRKASPTGSGIEVIAHPAAIALASVLSHIARRAAIRRSVIHIFEPASERGQQGIDELHQQTVAVLAFKKLKKDVFDSQLAFNLLAQYGEEAAEPLGLVEQRLERHLASLLAAYPSAALGDHRAIPMPSLRLIQGPVFHGHSFSLWIEFEENPGAVALGSLLADAGIDVRPDEPPSNAGIAGQSGLSVGAIAVDRNDPRACWMWMVADNLRLAAENAIAVAKENML